MKTVNNKYINYNLKEKLFFTKYSTRQSIHLKYIKTLTVDETEVSGIDDFWVIKNTSNPIMQSINYLYNISWCLQDSKVEATF